jgi:hypothetical protein
MRTIYELNVISLYPAAPEPTQLPTGPGPLANQITLRVVVTYDGFISTGDLKWNCARFAEQPIFPEQYAYELATALKADVMVSGTYDGVVITCQIEGPSQ